MSSYVPHAYKVTIWVIPFPESKVLWEQHMDEMYEEVGRVCEHFDDATAIIGDIEFYRCIPDEE